MRPGRRDRGDEVATLQVDAGVDGEFDGGAETLQDCLRRLVQLLPRVTRGLRRRHVPVGLPGLGEQKLGPRHGVALTLLSQRGPLSVGQLAGGLGLTLPTVSGLIAELEQAGFAERSADPQDRRRTIVTLSARHNQAITTWLDGVIAPMARALDRLSPAERATFLKGMALLEAELNPEKPPPPHCLRSPLT